MHMSETERAFNTIHPRGTPSPGVMTYPSSDSTAVPTEDSEGSLGHEPLITEFRKADGRRFIHNPSDARSPDASCRRCVTWFGQYAGEPFPKQLMRADLDAIHRNAEV
jgi:hypothetical protein